MATPNQDVGLGDERIFAGDTLRMTFAVTTGGTASGVTAASYKIADKAPTLAGTTLVEKTIGNGVTVTDGASSGVVDIAVVLSPSDTAALSGDYYHAVKITASGDESHVADGTLRLHPAAS